MNDDTIPPSRSWIRGVNVGGWLLAERFITPYLFAVNSCHLNGELCWYPGQIGAPPNASICDPSVCDPILPVLASDETANYHPTDRRVYMDYPVDEFTLGQTFSTSPQDVPVGKRYMERHWDTFVTRKDILNLKQAGVQYVRVPMGFWIRGDVHGTQEPFIVGGWPYFIRFAKWCREIGLEVWVDLHGAPGSENGFDNSGHFLKKYTCKNWSNNATNVARTLAIVEDISKAIVSEGLQDTVTGFGILNEPSPDCNVAVLRKYYDDAFDIVRSTLGLETAVFIGDMFHAKKFNDGWWGDDHTHYNTFLDSHPYHVFSDEARGFSPRQHIAYVCRNGNRGVNACCYQDHPRRNSIPADGISRIMGEWSAAFDSLPTALVPYIMQHIAATGSAPLLNRTLPPERKAFLRNFVEAQMVAYESRSTGVSSGWLFWNFKMEGGAFAEWDFLRGLHEEWIPNIPDPTVASEDLYGSCYDILNRSLFDYNGVVDEYPYPTTLNWGIWGDREVSDDLVLNDGYPVVHRSMPHLASLGSLILVCSVCLLIELRKYCKRSGKGYIRV